MRTFLVLLALIFFAGPAIADDGVRVKDLGRFLGQQERGLTGYGVVVGLSGTGDSPRNAVTRQTLSNVLGRLGLNMSPDEIRSRNAAVVIVTASLPSSANVGDRIDVSVSSVGDARSLVGGTLLMTPLAGPDAQTYAIAEGSLIVGGYQFEADFNRQQRNFPASGVITDGASVQYPVRPQILGESNEVLFVLDTPDFTTAQRIAQAVNNAFGWQSASPDGDSAVRIRTTGQPEDIYRSIATVENSIVTPASQSRVVVNERSGTIVAGGDVRISSVVISQGDIRVSVSVDNQASQPTVFGRNNDRVESLIVSNTQLDVISHGESVAQFPNTTVADLVLGLRRANVDTRGMISILQAMKAAGALHADVVIQ